MTLLYMQLDRSLHVDYILCVCVSVCGVCAVRTAPSSKQETRSLS
jgi:hypothetical protein